MGNYGIFLSLGIAGFISSTVGLFGCVRLAGLRSLVCEEFEIWGFSSKCVGWESSIRSMKKKLHYP